MSYPNTPYPYGGPAYPPGVTMTQSVVRPRSTVHIVVAWIFAGLTIGALLPWAIAATRGHKDVLAIALVNWLLGWTGIAWIICLVWSLTSTGTDVVVTATVQYQPVVPGHAAYPGDPIAAGLPAAPPVVRAVPYGQLSSEPYPQTSPQPFDYPSAAGWEPTQVLPPANGFPEWQAAPTRQQLPYDQDLSATRWDDRQDPR